MFFCRAHIENQVNFKGEGCLDCSDAKKDWRKKRRERRRNAVLRQRLYHPRVVRNDSLV
jgi:hypothetical protein